MAANKSAGKLDALKKRVTEMKAALEAVQAEERRQEKADRRHLEALVGAAMVADVEGSDTDERAKRKAYVAAVLMRHTMAGHARAFLKAKGWL